MGSLFFLAPKLPKQNLNFLEFFIGYGTLKCWKNQLLWCLAYKVKESVTFVVEKVEMILFSFL